MNGLQLSSTEVLTGARAASGPPGGTGQAVVAATAPVPARSGDAFWIPAGDSTAVAGLEIGGMVYVGHLADAERVGPIAGCLIDPQCAVASSAPSDTASFYDFFTPYHGLTPSERRTYLRWLAAGRSDPDVPTPCVRLYFHGLEHRLLTGDPDADECVTLLAEVRRLREIYDEDPDLDEELGGLLDIGPVFDPEAFVADPGEFLECRRRDLPLPLKIGLGKRLDRGEAIEWNWLLSWWLASLPTKARPIVRKCFAEFSELFAIRLAKQYPNGFTIRSPHRKLACEYLPANPHFGRAFRKELPDCDDVTKLVRPVKLAARLAQECADDLEAYGRFVQRRPREKDSVQAQLLLPDDLAESRANHGYQQLVAWAEGCLQQRGGVARIDEALETVEGVRPARARPRAVAQVMDALRLAGIGLAPHQGFGDHILKIGDAIALYRLPDPAKGQVPVSPAYQPVLTALRGAIYVAQADGSLSAAERGVLETYIDECPRLMDRDRAMLHVDLTWLVARKPSLLAIRRRCENYAPGLLQEIRELAAAVVSANGLARPAQVQATQKLYLAMGLPADDAFSGLHRMSSGTVAQPVTVFQAEDESAERQFRNAPRARPKTPPDGVALDSDRISKIVADTRKASAVLSDVFAEESAQNADSGASAQSAASVTFDGLDGAHGQLVAKLLQRPSWSESEFAALVKGCGLLPGGALEVINEWSFERFGDALLEEELKLVLNQEVAETLRSESAALSNAAA